MKGGQGDNLFMSCVGELVLAVSVPVVGALGDIGFVVAAGFAGLLAAVPGQSAAARAGGAGNRMLAAYVAGLSSAADSGVVVKCEAG